MTWIHGYGCTTAAGRNTEEMWSALTLGRVSSVPGAFAAGAKVCQWKGSGLPSARETLRRELLTAWREAFRMLEPRVASRVRAGDRLGVVLASTKSYVDDFIWSEDEAALESDALTPLLADFLASAELSPVKKITVSSACASSLSALFVADKWLENGEVDDVLVVAADLVGPFVYRGFECLRVLTSDEGRPFSRERSGFHLGEAAAAIVLSRDESELARLRGIGIDAEGFAITRPEQSGASLVRACRAIDGLTAPDLIIAHGTGTQVNDLIEDRAYAELFGSAAGGVRSPAVTGSKWCVGHTLAASGALDVIAACKTLETGSAFRLATTKAADPSFACRYLDAGADVSGAYEKILVSSLGFGGIHAAALLESPREALSESPREALSESPREAREVRA